MAVDTLKAFTEAEKLIVTDLLAAKVATMLGRKLEEGDWDFVYCNAKKIPQTDWSNLHIDINHNGLGVEHKMLRVTKTGSILNECGTTKMHPAGTRSIRIPQQNAPQLVMEDILRQYNELIDLRTEAVMQKSQSKTADMRIGWLLWKEALDEFLYFEERMIKPNPEHYYAEWNTTPARGARKESKSLWVYEKSTGKKKYSVTTSAGAKIQPYFDIPPPNDENLYHFRVQGVLVDEGIVQVWVTKSTFKYLELLLGSLDVDCLSKAISAFEFEDDKFELKVRNATDLAIPIQLRKEAYEKLKKHFSPATNDEYLLQQFAIHFGEIS